MKKLALIMLSIVLVMSYAQKIEAQISPTQWASQVLNAPFSYTFTDSALVIIDSALGVLYPNDTLEGGRRNSFNKFHSFISTRLPAQISNHDIGGMYAKALHEAQASTTQCGDATTNRGNWVNFGPENDPSYQNQGMVKDVWINPNDDEHIRVGTEQGGIFEKKANTNWINITDNASQLGNMGINSFTVHPTYPDKIWFTTLIPAKEGEGHIMQNSMWNYAMGIYYTDNGGVSWTKELTYPASITPYFDPELVYGCKIKYAPYQVNGQDYVILTIRDHILSKLGTAAWVDMTPTGLTTWIPPLNPTAVSEELSEIEFLTEPQNYGTFVISNVYDDFKSPPPTGVWRVDFNMTTGNIIGTPIQMITHDLNGFFINGSQIGNTYPEQVVCFNIEYMGNGEFYMITQYDDDADFSTWNISNVSITGQLLSRTVLLSNLFTMLNSATPRFMNKFECDQNNPNIAYIGTNFAAPSYFLLFKENSQWHINWLPEQGELHRDVRCIQIYHSDNSSTGVSDPGLNDIVYWGNDGGLSRTTNHEVIASNSAAAFDVTNLNGEGLFIADLTDMDHSEDGKSVVGAAFHDGWYAFDRVNNIWNGEIDGDGFNAKIDDRFASSTNSRMIYQSPFRNYSYIDNPVSSTAGVGINMPEGPGLSWRTSPMQFTGPLMYIGIRRGWQSDPWGYSSSTWTGLHINANLLQTYIDELIKPISYSPALEVSVKNPKRAYHMLHGRKLDWRLAKGDFNSNTLKWDWQDITHPIVATTDQYGQVYTYTDLVIDPNSVTGDRLFVSLGELPWNFASTNRVMVSGDAGATFTDKSTGLPPLPVNCLAYQEGSDDIIYAGTDAGVYYWDINLGCWVKMNNGMPNCIVSRLDIDYCRRKLIAATFGRGFWESDLIQPSIFPDVTDVIPQNTFVTWSGDKYVKGSILIEEGATLKINGSMNVNTWLTNTNIYMPKYGRILVKKGGQLWVNESRITSDCDWWYGISAYGDGSISQSISGGLDVNHGFINVSKSIIENAEEAMCNYGGDDVPNTGGIIQCSGSLFRNNWKSAAFMKFYNHQGTSIAKDLSFFTQCRFTVNDDMKQDFQAHITMWGVRGILLLNNLFENVKNLEKSHEKGVYTINASYDIDAYNGVSEFNGFHTGIESSDFSWEMNSLWPPRIEHTLFDRNEIGIYYNTSSLFTINNNILNIGEKQTPYPAGTGWQYYSLGSKLENTTNFSYCNNVHELIPNSKPAAASFQYTAGTEVYNTGDNDQQIENNTYTDLLIGNDAAYQCASSNGLTGLNYRRNTNTNNIRYDFIMQDKTQIRNKQFAQYTPNVYWATSNVFTQVPLTNTTMCNWYNWPGNNPVKYYYYSTTTVQDQTPNPNSFNLTPTNANEIEPTTCSMANTSLAKEDELTETELNALKNAYYNEEAVYDGLLNAYRTLIDAGNTKATLDYIALMSSTEAMALRDDMIGRSPYVSEKVLTALAKSNILPQPYLLEILVANPDATQSDALLDTLANYIPNPLPAYMFPIIESSWTGGTLRSQLEAGVTAHHDAISAQRNEILSIYGTSPSLYHDDSTLVWLQKVPTIRNRYHLIEYLLYHGLTQEADDYLEALPTDFTMSRFDETEYAAYQALYIFKKDLLSNSIELNQLDSTRKAQLKEIADVEDVSFARSMARNALCFFYQICYPDTVRTLPNGSSKQTIREYQKVKEDAVSVYPNPAQNYVSFQLHFSPTNVAQFLEVFDITGKQVYTSDLSKTGMIHVWNTQLIPNGTYIYKVKTATGEKYSGKVTIAK